MKAAQSWGRSIARRMNAALARRKYVRSLMADVLVVIVCLVVWLGAQEWTTVHGSWPDCVDNGFEGMVCDFECRPGYVRTDAGTCEAG